MSTTLKVLSAKKVIANHQITQGEMLVIEARDKSNYQLIDDQTGFGPQNIIAKREGKDLKLFLEDGDMSADVVIKGYYGDENSEEVSNLIVGQHENGGIYAYVPESGLKADAVSMLAEEVAAPQALGGEELSSAFWAFNPWWLLALVPLAAGIAIAASNNGSSGGGNDNTADKPILDAKADGSVTVKPGEDNTKVVVKYTDESGNEKNATLTKDANGNWSSDNPDVTPNGDGSFTIPADKVKDGSKVTATGSDEKGNTADTDAIAGNNPSTPRVPGDVDGDGDADDDDNDATTEKGAPKVSIPEATDGVNAEEAKDGVQVDVTLPKNTKAGDTVTLTVTKPDGSTATVEHEVTAAEEGANKATVTIPAADVGADGDYKVVAKVTTPDGQESKPSAEAPFSVDQTAPATPDVQAAADGSVTVEPKDENPVTIKYKDEATGEDKEFTVKKDDSGNWVSDDKPANVVVDPATGKVTIPATEVKDGEKVTATAKDPAGNEAKGEATAGNNPSTPRVPGDVDGDGDADDDDNDATTEKGAPKVSIPEATDGVNAEEAKDGVQVDVTLPKNTKAGDTVTLTVTKPDGSTATVEHEVTAAEEGANKATVTIPATDVGSDGDYKVVAKVTTPDGQESKPSAEAPFAVDQTAPSDQTTQVTVNNVAGDDVVNLTETTEATLPVTGKVTGEFKEGDKVDVKIGDEVIGTAIVNAAGEFTVNVPTEKLTGAADKKVTATVTATDPAGNTAEISSAEKPYTVESVDTTPAIDINDIAGQAQVAEGTEGYAQFLPSNIATEEISRTTENGVTTVVKGFVVKGTTTNVPADTEVDVTITANGENYFTGKAKVGADGTWEVKVPTSTVTTTVVGSGEDETTETKTEFNNPKFDTVYDVTAKVTVDGNAVTDTDKTESAPIVTDIYLQDKLTDDAPNVADFYTDTDKYVGRIDGMTDTDATKAISRQTGLTNDPTAALHFTLDKALKAGQTVKVLRYKIVDGAESTVEDLTGQMTNEGLNYTVAPTTPQSETTNQLYRYKVLVEDDKGFDLSEKDFTYRLDTIVEAMDVKELNSDTNTMVLQANGLSEIGATIKYKYYNGTGETDLKEAVDNGDGTYTLDLANWNRKVPGSITLQVTDAAGNVSETKINAVRNLFNDYTLEKGLNPNGNNFDDPLITGLGPNVGGQSSSLVADDSQTFAATAGNDTLIIGLDNFGGMGVGNGSVGRGIYVGGTNRIEMGNGDDHIHVRGTMQSMGADTDGYFDMGEGNDKITFGGTFLVGNYNIRMGEGNNVIDFGGTTVQAAGLDISYGDGNDVLRADVNKDFAGGKTISFGNGDNYMEVGYMYDNNEITFGNGNDTFIAKSVGTKAPSSGTIDMGEGNDTFIVSGLLARQEVKLGAGDDVAIMGDRIETGVAWARLDGGDGNDTLVLTKSDGKVSLQNVLNFEVIDLTAPTPQIIGISNDYITQANDTTKTIYIKGGTEDTVDFGDNGKYINGTKFKDGGGAIKSNWNFWEKTESDVVHEGITYDKYTYRTSVGDVNDEAIYIQQGIQII
ncbi:Ig-like domain-containing protein [Rodentibacter sp. Ppn85]|uniref:Ig-like domain-containing protein n=1 Tax=Rodentibacter sp. Ppn85 TaxID=1908525 RepID=UPI000987C55E|nr:Ig-like domain-containing protein [Rodentibacter sp. Ppn85]OOF64383.1 hypothetical protein BKL51_07500 [Rodentibacter sp. Ppn85]